MLRFGFAVTLALAFVVASVVPSLTDEFFGRAECGTVGGPGCDVGAESGGGSPGTPGGGGTDSGDGEGAQETSAEPACEVAGSLARCSTTVGGGGEAAEEEVDFEALAFAARAAFSLSEPSISMSPSADAPVLVRVPVWMWIDTEAWQEETATATVPGGSVTVAATPATTSWAMGDGTTVDCEGSGTAYDPAAHEPDEESPDCGHTYTSANSSYDLTASLSWEVEWSSSDGEGGALPALVTETSTSVRVIESSGVVT